ncbi:MAG: divalent-cation tolerance protein CutA [Sphingomonadaceae bacterium]|nr:divalent-cation tolerance protein CutA [Sphingomonadaceae bacterium]
MSEIVTVYAVFADAAEAERIARAMIERRLAACANILAPCRSIYRWQGAIETAEEIPALFKTRADQVEALIAAIAELHSYEVPAIVAWPIAHAWPAYGQWIEEEGR